MGPARQGPGQLVRPERESADPPRPDHVLGFAALVALGLLELARRGRARVLVDRVRARGNAGRTPERLPGRGTAVLLWLALFGFLKHLDQRLATLS